MSHSRILLALAEWGILIYFLQQHVIQFFLMIRGALSIQAYQREVAADELDGLFATQHYQPISLICPVYNEAAGVVASVNSLLSLRYPEIQVIVVNDGSEDASLEQLIQAFRLQPSHRVLRNVLPGGTVRGLYESSFVPNLLVVDKINGGKAESLNCGVNLARYPLVCCMDGDSLLENDSLLRIARPFQDRPHVVAAGGVVRPLNGCLVTPMGIRGIHPPASWLGRFQVVEYFRAFFFGRMGLASMDAVFILSGAFGVFRRDLLIGVGGFEAATIGEDFELVVRLHRHLREQKRPHHLTLVPDPVCWTEVPEDFRTLRRQRNRWQRGLLETLTRHRKMWFNYRYGRVGWFSMPYFLFFEAMAPLIETAGYAVFLWLIFTHALNSAFALRFFIVAILLGVLNSVVAVAIHELSGHRYQGLKTWAILMAAAVLENLGYRQLTAIWRLGGTLSWLRGKRGWGQMKRQGIGPATAP